MCPVRYATVLAVTAASLLAGCGGGTRAPATQPTMPSTAPAGSARGTVPATGSIGGVVVSADSHAPLPRARVVLSSPALAERRVAIADQEGRFEFPNLPPGAYSIAVSHSGYAPESCGGQARGPDGLVPLGEGEHMQRLECGLPEAGVIAGRVLDEDGAPLSDAIVTALAPRMQNGREMVDPIGRAQTDDRGEFRLVGLPPGRYAVSAFDPAFEDVGDDTGPLRYAPTYYPGVPLLAEARAVPVVAGAAAGPIEFRVRVVRPSHVSGVIITEDRRPLLTAAVILVPLESGVASAVSPRDVAIRPDGSFTFRNVPPGRYQIRARGEPQSSGQVMFSTFALTVEERDVTSITMILLPGGSIEGRVAVERDGPARLADFSGVRVRAPFVDGTSFGDAPTGDVQPDGSFRIRGVMSGAHHLTLEGLPSPWILKSASCRGRELTDLPFDVGEGERLTDVRVTITSVTTELHGMVRDRDGGSAGKALVIVLPSSPQFWSSTNRRLRVVRADAEGRYVVHGLPAGEYRAAASREIAEAEVYRQDVLRQFAASGVPVTLVEGDARSLDLRLAPGHPTGRR